MTIHWPLASQAILRQPLATRWARLVFAICLFFSWLAPAIPLPQARAAVSAPLSAGQNSFQLFGFRPESGYPLSYIQVPYSLNLNNFSLGITLEAWVRRDDASRYESVICNGWQQSYCLSFAGPKVRLQTSGGASYLDSVSDVPAGKWTHIAATYDRVYQRIYINGRLDVSRYYPGNIGASSGTPLGIGADLVNDYNHNYFKGLIDEVRIWKYARPSHSVQAGMLTSISGDYSSLAANWNLNGNAFDSSGGNHGIVQGGAWRLDGAMPHDLRIPWVQVTPVLDAACNLTQEYANAIQVAVYWNAEPTTAYLLHNGSDLWACFTPLTPAGHLDLNWTAVYIDRNWSRHELAQPDDLTLEVHNNYTTAARQGDGLGDYAPSTTADGLWEGKFASISGITPLNSAEFRIDLSLIGQPGSTFGLMLAQNWVNFPGDNREFPALSTWNSPVTWASATLAGQGSSYSFSGKVLYQPRNKSTLPAGIPGVRVNLVSGDSNGTWQVSDTSVTNLDGSFSLAALHDYSRHYLEIDPLSLPRGYAPGSSFAPHVGRGIDARVIDYYSSPPGSYSDAEFRLVDAVTPAANRGMGPYFLIIAPQAVIDSNALDEFTDYKRRLGFDVEVHSLESAQANYPGIDLPEKIRNLEVQRYSQFGSRFKYLMLVGPDDVIPYARMQMEAESNPALRSDPQTQCRAPLGGWPTDWYYADLVSNWDTNGNGCLGDGAFSNPLKQAKNNYIGDTQLKFQPTLSVGRLPFKNPNEIRSVLRSSMDFEQQTPDFKLQALLATSMFSLKGDAAKGYCWFPPDDLANGKYYTSTVTINNTVYECPDITGTGQDGSYLAEKLRSQVLDPAGFTPPVTFYENTPASAGGSPYKSPQVITETAIIPYLNSDDFGLVLLEGHGNGNGVYRTYWKGDFNGDGAVNHPTRPFGNPAKSAWEIGGGAVFTKKGLNLTITPSGRGAIWLVVACETGAWSSQDNFGAELLRQKDGIAWIGGVGTIPTTTAEEVSYQIAANLFTSEMRLGDAVWQALGNRMQQMYNSPNRWNWGWWVFVYTLFGDPSLAYWGNPGGDTAGAPWPMLRQTAYGEGYSRLVAPSFPKQKWTYPAAARVLDSLQPSPVVTRDNTVILAHAANLDILQNGQLFQRLGLNAPLVGTPALSADGTLYTADRNGLLYAIVRHPVSGFFAVRWQVDLVGRPLSSPIIGSDGFITLAVEDGDNSEVVLVRPDGRIHKRSSQLWIAPFIPLTLPGVGVGAAAVDAHRRTYLTTTAGAVWKLNLLCNSSFDFTCITADPNPGAPYTTPPLLAYGSLYAGQQDGTLVRKDATTLATLGEFYADSAITVGPIAGPGDQVLIGTQNGSLYSLSASLALRWAISVPGLRGMPAFSADRLILVEGDYLNLRNPYTGALESQAYLAASPQGGSVAIGYGREIFVQTGAGPLVAIGEGWALPPAWLNAQPVKWTNIDGFTETAMRITWAMPLASQAASHMPAALAGSIATPTLQSGFLLQRSAENEDWQDLVVLPAGASVFTDTTAIPGQWYSYRIQVLDAAGKDSDFTTLQGSLRSLPASPGAPSQVSVSALGADRLQVTWTPPGASEVSAYQVERASTAAGPYTLVGETSASSFVDQDLQPDTVYYYRVMARNETASSAPSEPAYGQTRSLALSAPQSVKAELLPDGMIEVSWQTGPAGMTAVIEGRAEGSAGYNLLGSVPASSSFKFLPTQVIRMSFRVKFVQGSSESPYGMSVLAIDLQDPTKLLFLPMLRR